MATEPEVRRAARELIGMHGAHAPRSALASVDFLLERGDLRLAADWGRVSDAAATLPRNRPEPFEAAH